MAFEKITEAELANVGVEMLADTPELSAANMKKKFEETAKELLAPKFNKLVDALNSGGAGSTGATVPGTLPQGTDSTVQGVLNALAKQTDDHLNDADNPHKVTAEQAGAYTKAATDENIATAVAAHADRTDNPHGVTAAQAGAYTKAEADSQIAAAVAAHAEKTDNPHGVTAAQVGAYAIEQTDAQIAAAVAAHADRVDNPHNVTAAQVGAYTKVETDAEIDKKVQAIGSADMVKAVYDPQGKEQDMFQYADDAAKTVETAVSKAVEDAAGHLQLQIDNQQEQIDAILAGDVRKEGFVGHCYSGFTHCQPT